MSKGTAAAVVMPAASSVEEADSALSQMNQTWLTPAGLASLAYRGVQDDGWLVGGIDSLHRHRWYSMARLDVTDPNGNRSLRAMRFSPNMSQGGRGCILVVLVNDHVVTVRQFRLPIFLVDGTDAAFTTELPRMFASAEAITTFQDKRLRSMVGQVQAGMEGILAHEARNVLSRELGQLVSQPGMVVEEMTSLGRISEWERSMQLVEVVLVRLRHPDLEALKLQDLGPTDLKIHLYPLSQLLRRSARQRVNMRDQASLAGLALAWGHLRRNEEVIQDADEVFYAWQDPKPFPIEGARRRCLEGINASLRGMGFAPIEHLGLPAPGGEILKLDQDPWFKGDGLVVLRFEFNGRLGPLPFLILRHHQEAVLEETLIATINAHDLLTVRAHHLPFLTHHNRDKAWCNRVPNLRNDQAMPENRTSAMLGETKGCLQYLPPGERLVAQCIREAHRVSAETLGWVYEDSGANAVKRRSRHLEMRLPPSLIDTINRNAGRAAQLVPVSIEAALQDPDAHGVRDQETLAALLTAAERVGLMSKLP